MTTAVAPSLPATRPVVTSLYAQTREPPAEWVRRLEEISPPSDDLGFLRLVWEPGDPWNPAQRWVLYEMIHPKNIGDDEELQELRGPHPRSEGHICTSIPFGEWAVKPRDDYQRCLCRRKLEAWRGGPCVIVTLTQWLLYQRTGYVGRPFWIIQGTTGGHKHSFTHDESVLLEQEGYPTSAPGTGQLPYAPFDERVVKQITRFNRLWQFNNSVREYQEAMGKGYAAYRRNVEKELRRELVGHLKVQMQDVQELFLRAMDKGELDNQPRTSIDYDRLEPQSEEEYIERGQILHHTRMR